MHTAQSRQKSYADVRRKNLEFEVGDKVFLKVAPMRGVLRFERRGKLSPRFVGPFEILERIGPVAYRLALPPSLLTVHDVFHVSMLRKYVPDPSHVVDYEPLEIDENLSYTEQPVEVLAREVKTLRNKEIPLVVLWRNHRVEEATWEREDDMRSRARHSPAVPSSSSSYIVRRCRLHPFSSIRVSTSVCASSTAFTKSTPRRSSPSSLQLLHPTNAAIPRAFAPSAVHLQPTSLSLSSSLPSPEASPSSSRVPDADRTPRGVAFYRRRCNRGLMLKFTVPRQVNLKIAFLSSGGSVARGLNRGHNQVSGKGFPTTGPRIEAGNVVIHRGLHVTRPLVVACVPSGVRNCLWIDTDAGCSVRGSLLSGLWSWSLVVEGRTRLICASFGSTRLIRASFGSTKLICASLGITRLIGVSFGITRLIRASFGITRLICAFYGTTRLLCKGTARGRPTRGKKDA
ncbi:pol protein [Cucumis melo var. makuwa]|uniref:Pol protein n=1 Tax=Cucumis melo var. makuwa TaxID=1194695 RepID=A0A5A7TZZ4_CUCMM|nr:pol protein [Cucumis melo var. makuwa]